MENKKHWIVLAVCCGLAASSIGVSINSSGVFYTPVSESLGIMRGTFSMHMTIFSLVTAMGALFIPRIMKKVPYKILLSVSVGIAVFATGAMAYARTIPVFYILGAVRGLSTGMFSIVPLTMIVNNWFEKKHGLATSVVFGFSGLAGSICSPILSGCIETMGWQTGYLIKAAILLALCLPAVIYPFHINPQKDGLLPYGFEEKKATVSLSHTSSFHFMTTAFISFFIFGLLCSCITSITQHLPGYGESIGYNVSLGATLLSAGMIGNIVSKLIIGVLSDAIGAVKATITMIIANVIGIILLMMGSSSWLLILGAFLFGSCYSIGAVSLPLLTKSFFGVEHYATVFPTISFASNLGAAISLSMVGYIYDFFGSYMYAFIIALIMIGVCMMTLTITIKTKYKVLEDGEECYEEFTTSKNII